MATIINTPGTENRSDTAGLNLILGAVIAIALIVLFFVYAVPALRQNNAPTVPSTPVENQRNDSLNIRVNVPSGNGSTTSGTGGGIQY